MGWKSTRGSVTISRRGSLNCGQGRGGETAVRMGGEGAGTGGTHLLGDLVGEGAGRVAAGDGLRTRVRGVLKHRALCIRPRRDGNHVGRGLNRHNHARRKLDLLPRLGDVKDVDAVCPSPPDVLLHFAIHVLGAQVRGRRDEQPDGLIASLERRHF